MMSKKLYFAVILILYAFALLAQSQENVTIKPKVFERALNNPLKGFRPNLGEVGKHPYDAIVRSYTKWDTTRPLANPDKGWYHHMLDNGIGQYLIQDEKDLINFPGMDHLYLRLVWAYLESEEGVYNWEVIDTIIDKYVPRGYGISFRISCKETGWVPNSIPLEIDGVGYATPPWVRKAGAKSFVPDKYGPPVWTPDWDDPVYLEKLNNFHKVFAQRYDGKPWLRYVDVGSIGEWGERNAHCSTNIAPTVEEVKANIDIYLNNYKHSQLVVTDALMFWHKSESEAEELYNYAVSHGITLRDDSPMVKGHMKNFRETCSISHPHFYDPLYLKKTNNS